MATSMGPLPPKNPTAAEPSTSEPTNGSAMVPPLPRNPNPSEPEPAAEPSRDRQEEDELNPPSSVTTPGDSNQVSNSSENLSNGASANGESKQEQLNSNLAVPYKIPPWSGPPGHEFSLEVLKDGAIIS